MKKRLLPFVLAGALTAAFAAPAAAQTDCDVTQIGNDRGGVAALAGLIAAAVGDVDIAAGVNACDIDVLNNSLNNLLRNADILNDSLNNLLRDANIEVLNITGNVITVDILSGPDIYLVTLTVS